MMGYYPNSWHASMFSIQGRKEASVLSRSRKEIDFTQSLDMSLQNEQTVPSRARASDFTQSVAVVPSTSDGKYSVYTGVHDNVSDSKNTTDTVNSESWFLSSMRYGHNIGNPDRRYQRSAEKSESIKAARKQSIGGKMKSSGSKSTFGSKLSIDRLSQLSETKTQEQCKCNGLYHSHTFDEEDSFGRSMKMEKKFIPRRKSSEVWQANDHQSLICNIFWRAEMSFSGYKHGDKVVNFKELWPKSNKIDTTLVDSICVEGTGLRDSLWELILLLVTGGPVWVLKSLIDLKFIGKDYQYNGDCTLLHLACVLQNIEVTQLCIQYGLSSNVQDKSGQTAFEVTKCSRIRKQTQNTSTKIQASFSSNKSRNITLYKPTQRDVDELFRLAENPKCVYEFQKKIQTYELNINQLKKDGDLLVHIAARSGLGHLPFLMSIIQIQKADINLYNNDGMTPLMISAQDGNDTMCETMMCLFGADPNLQNIKTKKTALHYAVTNGYINVINCLIKRGADFNLEDDDMCRPDDVFMEVNDAGDCREAVLSQREQRMENLKQKIINGTVYIEDVRATDLSVVDHDDYTPVMIAAIHNRPENLNTLLTVSKATINAQHSNTGLTALAMAAKNGHAECCRVLFKHGVNAGIADIKIYLPLHYAVLNNHEYVVDAFREHFPDSYIGLHKALNLCRRSSIHDKLTDAFSVRQEKIISPQLRISSMEGNAEKLYCLLEEGDDVNMKSDLNGLPAVFIAVEFGHVEVVKLLIEKGADLTKRDPRTGNTVLHVAASNGQLTTVEYLLQFCKNTTRKHRNKLDVNSMNNDKRTALQFACEKGYNKIIKLLLDNGATTALLNSQGTLFTTAEYEGARSLIEGRRNEHTNVIFKLVSEKSKKALPALMQVWMPRFDHNLRDKLGDTPLMVACSKGLLETVKFLLQSAVYANQVSQEEVDNSDTDSGVTDLPPWRSYPAESKYHDELSKSMEGLLDHDHTSVVPSYDATRTSLNPGNFLNSLPGPLYGESSKMNSYLTDIERPKGLYIYHDSIVSHVCAVNLFDGNTPLHRTIQGGDNVVMATIIIEADSAVINMQNDAGFTPVHLACKLKRKKILRKLLAIKGVDLSLLTLNGELPEEVTSNKTLQRMVKMARDGQPDSPRTAHSETMTQHSSSAQSFTESLPSVISQGGASTINFDKIHDLYTSLRTAKYQSEK